MPFQRQGDRTSFVSIFVCLVTSCKFINAFKSGNYWILQIMNHQWAHGSGREEPIGCQKGNGVFVTNSNFLLPIFMQPYSKKLWYFKFTYIFICDIWSNRIRNFKYQSFTLSGCKIASHPSDTTKQAFFSIRMFNYLVSNLSRRIIDSAKPNIR